MRAKLRSWWKDKVKPLEIVGVVAILIIVIVLIYLVVYNGPRNLNTKEG